MNVMQAEVVNNEQNIYSGKAMFVVIPTVQGELDIYPRHEPIMSSVRPGTLRLTVFDQTEGVLVAVSEGLLEVQSEKIAILVDVVVRSGEMDQAQAEEAKEVAEAGIPQTQDDKSLAKAQVALVAVAAQLKTLDCLRS